MKKRCKCGKPLVIPPTGRRPTYCSDACKQRAYRKRHQPLRGTCQVMGSSRSVEWPTDPTVFARLEEEFGPFTLDPCATTENAKCGHYFTKADDGLRQRWTGRVYMNPPYGRQIKEWMRKAWEASQTTAELVVCLVPVRTGSAWWQDCAMRGEIRFLRGRLRFVGSKNSVPFDSAVVLFRNGSALRNGGGVAAEAATFNPPGWTCWRRAVWWGLLVA